MRHLAPTATPVDWKAQRAAYTGQDVDVNRFRSALQSYLGVTACFLASSGRTSLFMLLRTLQQGTHGEQRREIVLPAYTCPSLAKVVVDAGLRPRFVDIGPYTLSYNMTELATAVSEQTLAVVLVHPFGIPHPVDDVMRIAEANGVLVIEDAAQSMGARTDGRHVGTSADFGLYSLGPGKPMSTGGGGFVCTRDEAAADLLRSSWNALPPASSAGSKLAALRISMLGAAFHPTGWWLATRLGAQRVGENEASWRYALRGLSPGQAAAGLTLLSRLDEINAGRRYRGEQLTDALGNLEGVQLPSLVLLGGDRGSGHSPGEATHDGQGKGAVDPIYLRLPIMFDTEERREAVLRKLHASGIGAGRMYRKTLAQLFPNYADGVYPGAECVAKCLLTLPTHHYVLDQDVLRMAEIIALADR
jgi:perosamine synthetase